jgi:hypothetical protein
VSVVPAATSHAVAVGSHPVEEFVLVMLNVRVEELRFVVSFVAGESTADVFVIP